MNKYFFIAPFISLVLFSCGMSTKKTITDQLPVVEDVFTYTDKNGSYSVRVNAGYDKKKNIYSAKRIMELPNKKSEKVLEQMVTLSSLGVVKNKTLILRPKHSQYNVWFDGKKYFSELKINSAKKAIDVKMISPEAEWNGTRQVIFPNTKTLPCFFSQIIECAKVSGFIEKASVQKKGKLSLIIIWEGYPFLNETLSDFPIELFSEAELEYDGKTKDLERRFNLRVAGQSIFYILNEKNIMTKMFWVSQGISMVSKAVNQSESQEGETDE